MYGLSEADMILGALVSELSAAVLDLDLQNLNTSS